MAAGAIQPSLSGYRCAVVTTRRPSRARIASQRGVDVFNSGAMGIRTPDPSKVFIRFLPPFWQFLTAFDALTTAGRGI